MGTVGGKDLSNSANQVFAELIQQPTTAADKKGLADLQQLTDQLLKTGFVSEADVREIVEHGEILNPSLTPPNQALLNSFFNQLQASATPGGSGSAPIAGGNAFLNCSAILSLFMMTSEIIKTESQIQLKENLYKSKVGLVLVATAKAAYSAALAQGAAEAAQYMAQFAKATTDASLSLAQVGLSVVMQVAKQVEENRQMNIVKASPGWKDGTPQNRLDLELQAQRSAQTNIQFMQSGVDGIIQAAKSFNEATMDLKEAKLALVIAQQKATNEILNQLSNVLSQSSQMLGTAADDVKKVIQAMMDLFKGYSDVYQRIGAS